MPQRTLSPRLYPLVRLKLAAPTPGPEVHLLLYHGVLAHTSHADHGSFAPLDPWARPSSRLIDKASKLR